MSRAMRVSQLLFASWMILLSGCLGRVKPDDSTAAPQPQLLTVESLGANSVTLRWTVSDSTGVSGYRVYRRASNESSFQLVLTTPIQRGTVTNLQTGTLYAFEVAALNSTGHEGPRSPAVVVRPAILNIAIDGLAEVTDNEAVSVQVGAPGFNQVRMAESVAGVGTAPYFNIPGNNVVSFTLTGGDGTKTLYAQFRDGTTGSESEIVSDDIVLDRFAQITSVTQNTGGATKTAGQIIHFTLVAGEPDGNARVDIGSAKTGIQLYDDGSHGDAVAGNGTYEFDYVVEGTYDANGAQVIGKFTDRAGNSANPFVASGTVTISNPPPAVTLTSAVALGGGRVQLQWTQSGVTDFFAYRVRHSPTSPVSPSGTLDTTLTARTSNTVTISNVLPGSQRFVVEVVDNAGNFTASNEQAVTVTGPALAPAGAAAIASGGSPTNRWALLRSAPSTSSSPVRSRR